MSFHGKNSNNPQKSIFITNVFFVEKKALLADNAGTFHAFKSLFGFGHVFSFVAVNCFNFWNLVWICEGFWQIFALECALCCCMLIVIGQWTALPTLATLGVILTKDLSFKWPFSSPPKKNFYLFLCTCVLFFSEQQLGNAGKCMQIGKVLQAGATLCWNCVSNHLPRCQPQNKRQPW